MIKLLIRWRLENSNKGGRLARHWSPFCGKIHNIRCKTKTTNTICGGSVAHPAGFEPTACRLGGGRSILLSYGCLHFMQGQFYLLFRYLSMNPVLLLWMSDFRSFRVDESSGEGKQGSSCEYSKYLFVCFHIWYNAAVWQPPAVQDTCRDTR